MPTPTNPKIDAINEATQTPVTSAVPLGLHPDSIKNLAQDLTSHEASTPAYSAGRTAQKLMHDALRDMQEAENQTRLKFGGQLVVDGKSIQREIPEDRRAQLAADLGARFESTARSFDRQFGVVADSIEALNTAIQRVLTPKKDSPASAQAASDIRNYVRGLDEHKRLDFLHDAAKNGDQEVISSVLATSGFVSGLNREQAAMIKDMASQGLAPKEYKARQAALKLADQLRASSQNFVQAYKKLQPVLKPSAHATAIAKLKEA